jgi:translocation and assembly module TamB
VDAEGNVELNEQVWRTNGLPVFNVRVHGTNVPLARNPGILLRSDFDLAVTNSISELPLISGSLTLRDSLLLADLKSLASEQAASPEMRPPFFSVEAEPWAAWRLQVTARGNSSLRVQTPLFHGKVSLNMKLEGTLKDPIALGQVKIDSGSVTFPFGSLEVKQGYISLTSENPYHPQLFVTATAQRFGYDIKMEVTGAADEPVVLLSSIPPLSSEQIILMFTTGQVPRGIATTTSTGQRAQGMALFTGKNLLSDFGLGGSGDERLTIRSGEEISQSGRPTYGLEYKLNDRWSVVGEHDRFDQYNLNLKWKVYSK